MDFIPGIAQAFTRVCISYPFDIVKVNMQKNDRSLRETVTRLILKDKNRLYRGLALPLASVSFERALTFKYYEDLNKHFNPALSGAVVSILSTTINTPSQYLSTNIALTDKKHYINLQSYIREHMAKNSLLKGFRMELCKNYIGTAVYLGVYGNLRNLSDTNSLPLAFINGSLTSIATWSVIYPIDTIRTLYQTSNNVSYKKVITDRIKSRGYLSLWRGIGTMYLKSLPSSGIGMVVYELARRLFIDEVNL